MIIIMFVLSMIKIVLSLSIPIITMKILDESISHQKYDEIIMRSLLVLGITAISSLINYKLEKSYSDLGKKIYFEYQGNALNQFINLTGDYYTNMSFGEVFNTIYEDVERIQGLVSSNVFQFIIDIFSAIGVLIILLKMQWDLVILLVLFIPVIFFLQNHYQKKGRKLASISRKKDGQLIAIIEDLISNIIPFQYSRCENLFYKKYKSRVKECKDNEINLSLLQVKNGGILSFLSQLFSVVIIGYGGIKVVMGKLTIGGLIAFNMYGGYIVAPILEISGILMFIQSNIVSLDRVDNFLSLPSIKSFGGGIKLRNVESIEFEDVDFSYGKTSTLKNINALFNKNDITMIVGESGSGKSTLLSLLFRFWDCNKGSIKINGIDIKNYDIKSLRDNISIVSQNMYLFNDTVYNNLITQENVSRERINQVLKLVCLDKVVKKLPDGLDTIIGESGVKLSGGENQRLCLARMLLRDSPILIFDEATSALDQITERNILYNITCEKKNKIIIIITHRMENCKIADNILVINRGKKYGDGTHEVLVHSNEYYKRLYKMNATE